MLAASQSFMTVEGVVEAWEDPVRSTDAWNKYVHNHPRGAIESLGGAIRPADSDIGKRTAHVWMAKPWKWRVETYPPVVPHLAVVVVSGGHWWLSDGAGEVSTNQGFVRRNPDATGLYRRLIAMLVPGSILDAHTFEGLGERKFLGRRGLDVKAVPTEPNLSCWPTADEVRMLIDASRGVILAWEAYSDDAPYSGMEVRDIRFDQRLGEELFTFTLEPGARVRRFGRDG
jgi:outer membrane lipoprotein-sorting protein